jgi:hypothetical protein
MTIGSAEKLPIRSRRDKTIGYRLRMHWRGRYVTRKQAT